MNTEIKKNKDMKKKKSMKTKIEDTMKKEMYKKNDKLEKKHMPSKTYLRGGKLMKPITRKIGRYKGKQILKRLRRGRRRKSIRLN